MLNSSQRSHRVLFPLQTGKQRGEYSPTQQHMHRLPLLFVNPVAYFQRAGFSTIFPKTHVYRVHTCTPVQMDTTGMHSWMHISHTHSHQSASASRGSTCGMTAMPKH